MGACGLFLFCGRWVGAGCPELAEVTRKNWRCCEKRWGGGEGNGGFGGGFEAIYMLLGICGGNLGEMWSFWLELWLRHWPCLLEAGEGIGWVEVFSRRRRKGFGNGSSCSFYSDGESAAFDDDIAVVEFGVFVFDVVEWGVVSGILARR